MVSITRTFTLTASSFWVIRKDPNREYFMLLSRSRAWAVCITGVLGTLATSQALAQAQDGKSQQCASNFEDGQRLRKEGKVKAASEALIACAQAECPAFIANECTKLYSEAQTSLPSVTVRVLDAASQPATNVKVVVDGEPLAKELDGRAIPLDPGVHEFKVTYEDGTSLEQKVLLAEGEKNKLVTFEPEKPQTDASTKTGAETAMVTPEKPGSKLASYIVGGVGLAAIGAGVGLHFKANSDYKDAEKSCKPNCDDDEVNSIDRTYLFSEIAMGVGGAAVVTSVVLFFVQGGFSSEKSPTTAWAVGPVGTSLQGVGASYSGRF
jgi:hypothetical protein